MSSYFWSALMIALFFGGSIFVHELGHFLAARKRGLKVERFSIGFGPRIAGWKGKDGVDYRLSLLPFGGYVALPQLADMSAIEGKSEETTEPLPAITYTTKVIVFAAGAFFNLVFAFILASVLCFVGQPSDASIETTRIGYVSPTITLEDGTQVTSPAAAAGVLPGDTIRSIDGKPVQRWSDIQQYIFTGTSRTDEVRNAILSIERDGQLFDIEVHPVLAGDESYRRVGIAPDESLTVAEIKPGSIAEKAGFKEGDLLVSLNGIKVRSFMVIADELAAAPNQPVTATVQRADGQTTQLVIPDRTALAVKYNLGWGFANNPVLIHVMPWTQMAGHAQKTFDTLYSLIHPSSDVGISKLSGPVGIARVFHVVSQIDIRLVLWFTVLVNVNLAMLNLLPIPVLDGGHIAFATIAKLRGRPLPMQVVAGIQSVFVALLFTMIIYVTFFDVRRIARDSTSASSKEPAPVTAPAEPAPAEAP